MSELEYWRNLAKKLAKQADRADALAANADAAREALARHRTTGMKTAIETASEALNWAPQRDAANSRQAHVLAQRRHNPRPGHRADGLGGAR